MFPVASAVAEAPPSPRRPSGYTAPLRDMRFVLDHLVDLAGLSALPAFAHADPDTVYGLLAEFGRFVAEVLAPLDRPGDVHGSTFDPATHEVTTPPGFRAAYGRYVDAGWGSVPFDPAFGGGGFPWLVAVAMQELVTAGNMAFSLCPLLTQGAIDLLSRHGSEGQRERYLRPMVSGQWTGTMNLTEPDAGSDLGAIRTRAERGVDGAWRITGTKIFITYGDHDLAPNIVHLVLARVAGSPPGTRGLSCFIVPKFVLDDDGAPGARNAVTCGSIEHKLGIHASPTCVLDYDGAEGELVGEVDAGMRYMFTMMNTARLSVGLEGLAVAEVAYQQAHAYACVRRQGRAVTATPGDRAGPGPGPAAIVEHADVRRMLMTMRATIEAMRSMLYLNAAAFDLARHAPDPAERTVQAELVELLTPVSKAWCTDMGMDVARLATQVHGGMGFIEETGIAQRERDLRISAIYEGTNGIQAIDLVTRKLAMRGGGVVNDFLDRMAGLDGELAAAGAEMASIRHALAAAVATLREATDWVLRHRSADPNDALAAASPYLRMFGTTVGGWVMARQALAACRPGEDTGEHDRGAPGPGGFLGAKVATARFYCEQLLPQAAGLLGAVTAGAGPLFALSPDELSSVAVSRP